MKTTVKYLWPAVFGLILPAAAGATSVADLERQVRASDQARVQMQQQLDMMNQDLNSLIGRLEETNNAMADLQKNQQELFKQISDLTARMNQLQSGAKVPASTSANTAKEEVKPKPVQAAPAAPDEKNEYQKAVTLVMQDKNYNGAIQAFNAFIKKYPNSWGFILQDQPSDRSQTVFPECG